MIKSMTGYGSATISDDKYEVNIEVKTLNSKFADVSVRLPSQLSSLELKLRKKLIDGLERGKISVSVEVNGKSIGANTAFDEELLNEYYAQFKQASEKLGHSGSDLFTVALHAPGVLKTGEDVIDEEIIESIDSALESAIDNTNIFRSQEGNELYEKLKSYILEIKEQLNKIDPLDKERIAKIEERIKQSLLTMGNSDVDENRFEQELIYYIEKLDINEEKVRLANHLSYFLEVLESKEANGKKLGFISQELGREINTIGSKANSAAIQRIVVEMKEELEKIKEQALNVL
jgi:uncharacterized protein (TIGR00255 family)